LLATVAMARVFLLSPARLDGRRGQLLFRQGAVFPIATALRTREGCPIGDVFAFVSGLYFRGKLSYARRFSAGGDAAGGVHVITPSLGLVDPDRRVNRRT